MMQKEAILILEGDAEQTEIVAGMLAQLEFQTLRIPLEEFKSGKERLREAGQEPALIVVIPGKGVTIEDRPLFMKLLQEYRVHILCIMPPGHPLARELHEKIRGKGKILLLTNELNLEDLETNIRYALEQERLEQSYRDLIDEKDSILKSLKDGVVATDNNGRVVFLNPAAEILTGWSRSESLNRDVTSVVQIDVLVPDVNVMEQIANTHSGEPPSLEVCEIVARDGSTTPVETSISPLRDRDSNVTGVLIILRDITAKKEAEDRLRLASRVFESTIEGVMITDASTRILSVNPAFVQVTGYEEEEVLGLNPRFLKSGRHSEIFYDEMWSAVKRTGHWQGEIWNRRKNGEIYPAWLNISVVKNDRGHIINYVGIFSDITSRKEAEERLNYLASHDPLTGIPNRMLFYDRLEHAIARSQRNDTMLAVLFMDLDRFKRINDTMGHHVGDLLLKAVASRLQKSMRESDTVARFGGDEFILILEQLVHRDDAVQVTHRILESFRKPFVLDGHTIRETPSIGISFYPDHGESLEILIRNADAAMYVAKEDGRNNFKIFDDGPRFENVPL